jgi:L-alanine-DL-glutamate epimerase-like enolase superfamily enzyme
MLAEPVRITGDGMLTVPSAPGLGFEIDEERLARLA